MSFSVIDLAQLLAGRSAAQVFNDALNYIANPPDPNLVMLRTSNWRTGGPYKTLLNRLGLEIELLYQLAANFAGSAFLRYAPGRDTANPTQVSWLDWLGEDFFDEPRQGAAPATVNVVVTVAAGFGPYGPVQLRVKASNGQTFVSTGLVSLAAGPSISAPIAFRAEVAGAAGNVGANTITELVSPNVLGITLTNPAAAANGADIESDDRYRVRLAAKWAVLATGSPAAAYVYWALTASTEVKKVAVCPNSNNGTFAQNYITLVLSGYGVPVSGGAVTAVFNYINPLIPVATTLYCKSGVAKNVALTGNVKVAASAYATAATEIANSLAALDRRVPIGGYTGIGVALSSFVDSITYDPNAVLEVGLTNPTGNTALAFDEFLVTNPAALVLIQVP